MKKLSFLVITVLLISILAGCGGITIPTGDGGKIKLDGDKVEFTNEDGESGTITVDEDNGSVSIESGDGSFSSGAGLPKDWPQELMPIIDGGKVVQGGRVEEKDGGETYLSLNAVIEVDKSLDEIKDFYGKVMENAEDLTKMNTNDMATIGGYLGEVEVFIMVQHQSAVINLHGPIK